MSTFTNSSILSTGDVQRKVLSNGLVVLTRESHASPTVTTMIWYGVGSRNERQGETGRSHFLEHMLFKGTEKLDKGEIDLLTMKNGGSNNAFTSYDFTAYYFSFASDRWERALEIEADRMVNTIFDPVEFELEKKVVIEEMKAGLDQPWGLLMQKLSAAAFDRHPYRNPIVGWQKDLERTTRDGLEAYYRTHYHPGNAILVLVGDFNTEDALIEVDKAFGSIPAAEPSVSEVAVKEPPQTAEKRIAVRWRSGVPRLAIAYHVPQIGHKDSYALQLLSVVLAEGKSSRLYQRMIEGDQLATFAIAEYAESRDPALFYIRAESRGNHTPEEIEAAIHDELGRVGTEGVSEHELDRAKHQIEAHFVLTKERNLDQAILLGQIATLDSLDYIDNYLLRMNAVKPAYISDVCGRYLFEQNRTIAWLLADDTVESQS